MKRSIAMIAVLCVLVTAGCADEPDQAADETDPTAQATETPGATEAVQAGGDCQDSSKDGSQADLEMQDFMFAPKCLQMSTAQGLRLHNEGEATHNFSVEGFAGLDVNVEPGQENNTEPTGLEPGDYTMLCKIHRESYEMEGTLKVVEP